MPNIGLRCHELRVNDETGTFRIMYRVDADAIVVLDVFMKKTKQTSQSVIAGCKRRLRDYDQLCKAEE
jgi:phage-related protein